MDKATIRCSVKSTLYPENPVIYSNNDTVSLIPSKLAFSRTLLINFLAFTEYSYIHTQMFMNEIIDPFSFTKYESHSTEIC